MDYKDRHSFEDSASSTSTFRRLTRSPTSSIRFGTRRQDTTDSTSTTSSIESIDNPDQPKSCVSLQTSRDECALSKFIAWVAVKRNVCSKLTPQERLECPLLRCRQRFADHESMLQHLVICKELFTGEYWCYDCGKVERFSDAKCTRCVGHPSKRRKIMKMAKNLFSSLGHKPKNTGPPELHFDEEDAPPSYDDSLLEPAEPELQATEIHEIDSSELSLPTIIEDDEDIGTANNSLLMPMQFSPSHLAPTPPLPTPSFPAELSSGSSFMSSPSAGWGVVPQPATVSPADLLYANQARNPQRPILQLHTTGLEQIPPHSRARSSNLTHSSSTRSNASTMSTNSTASTSSYNISPMSNWSGAWSRSAASNGSSLTSPIDDATAFRDFLPNNPYAKVIKAFAPNDTTMDDLNMDDYLNELPADLPMLGFQDADNLEVPASLQQCPPNLFEVPAADMSLQSHFAMTDDTNEMPATLPELEEPVNLMTSTPLGTATGLVDEVKAAMETHIALSLEKLKSAKQNHLIVEFSSMSSREIILSAFEALRLMLRGQQPTSPVHLLCLVHLVYSFSLVVHEQDAPNRWSNLFSGALSYSSCFFRNDLVAYVHVVILLWKPSDMTDGQLKQLIRSRVSQQSAVAKSGKSPELEPAASRSLPLDSFPFVAQYFLDELEYLAINESNVRDVQASDLVTQHMMDQSHTSKGNPAFAIAVTFMIKILSRNYCEYPAFVTAMQTLENDVRSNRISTVRRLELELMHAGRVCLHPDVYFDRFIKNVGSQMDELYGQRIAHLYPRSTYYEHGIHFMNNIIEGSDLLLNETANTFGSVDDFMASVTPGLNGFGLNISNTFDMDGFPNNAIPLAGLDIDLDISNISPQIMLPTQNSPNLTMPGSSSPTTIPPTVRAASLSPAISSGATSLPFNAPSIPPQFSPALSPGENASDAIPQCDLCDYRPKGAPKWFSGSMAKHKKIMHGDGPPKIYSCPYPGCNSQYKNRPDNLRQHQIDKNHFVDGELGGKRSNKRRKFD